MNKLIAIVLGAVAVLCTYWAVSSGQAEASNEAWTWLGKTLTPAEAGSAQVAFVIATTVAALGSLIGWALDRGAAAKRATN